MKKPMKSITVTRNAMIVGRNSASYNDKHPTPTITLRPIKNAIAFLRGSGKTLASIRRFVRSLSADNKPVMMFEIAATLYSLRHNPSAYPAYPTTNRSDHEICKLRVSQVGVSSDGTVQDCGKVLAFGS